MEYLSACEISKITGISHSVVYSYLSRPEFNIYREATHMRANKYFFTDTCKTMLMNLYNKRGKQGKNG